MSLMISSILHNHLSLLSVQGSLYEKKQKRIEQGLFIEKTKSQMRHITKNDVSQIELLKMTSVLNVFLFLNILFIVLSLDAIAHGMQSS